MGITWVLRKDLSFFFLRCGGIQGSELIVIAVTIAKDSSWMFVNFKNELNLHCLLRD